MNLDSTAAKSKRSAAFDAKNQLIREQLWPDVPASQIWNRKTNKGFTTIPRTLSLLMVIMDTIAEKGKPVSCVYFDLWCRANDHGVVKIQGNMEQMAQCSGFSGQRAVSTWSGRLDSIEKMGFIKLASGASGSRSNALLLNPHLIVQKMAKKGQLDRALWNSLLERAIEIGASDVLEPIQPAPVKKSTVKNAPRRKAVDR